MSLINSTSTADAGDPAWVAVGGEPGPADVAALPGVTLLEFGTPWCGFCAAAQPLVAAALAQQTGIRHLKIEDGRGRRLGRSFGVKLWPTLVVLRDGEEVARVVRPQHDQAVSAALALAVVQEAQAQAAPPRSPV